MYTICTCRIFFSSQLRVSFITFSTSARVVMRLTDNRSVSLQSRTTVLLIRGYLLWRRALLVGQPTLPSSASQTNSLSKFISVYYERRASSPWRDLAIGYPRSRLGWLEIFHINAHKWAGPPIRGLASQISVHTTKFVLTSIFLPPSLDKS